MLAELTIRDYVLVDELRLDLETGTSALTGETGAGKSLLVGALKLLLGDRADPAAIRAGAGASYVEGCFRFSEADAAPALLAGVDGFDAAEGELIVAREVAASGRSRAWVQGRRVPIARLRELVRGLMDLHGQHAHQSLLRLETHRELIDAYGELGPLRDQVAGAHARAKAALDALHALEARLAALEERRDLARFQLDELRAAELVAGEEEELERCVRRLTHAEAIAQAVARAGALLGRAREELERGARFDPALGACAELIDQAETAVDEALRALSSGREGPEPGADLDRLQARLAQLADLRRKYRVDHAGLIARRDELERSLGQLEGAEEDLAGHRERLRIGRDELSRRAAALGRARRKAGGRLASAVERELAELGMEECRFQVGVAPLRAEGALPCGPEGADRAEFRVATNVGEKAGALAKIGSGGELSRVMLAIKTVLSAADPVPLLVFDEIDSGVGGESALKVGARLAGLGSAHQVLVVTHLASIAAAAEHQFRVTKSVDGRRTLTAVEPVEGDERVAEIARMLAGDRREGAALDHARTLLARTGGES